jgi:hypothetical protein
LNFFLFLTESNLPITHLNRKSEPVKIDLHFTGGLGLIVWLCGFTWMTTLNLNPPKPAQCPPLASMIYKIENCSLDSLKCSQALQKLKYILNLDSFSFETYNPKCPEVSKTMFQNGIIWWKRSNLTLVMFCLSLFIRKHA